MDLMINRLIVREGGYSDVPGDLGGCTKYGITLNTFREDRQQPELTCASLHELTHTEAADIYRRRYLVATHIEQVPHAAIRELLFDSAVQHGPLKAIEWLQNAVGAVQDGALGPKTLAQLARCDTRAVFAYIYKRRLLFYAADVLRDASQMKFLEGWLSRMGNVLNDCLQELGT